MSEYQANIVIKNPATPAGPYETGAAPGVWRLSEVLPFVRQGIWPTPGIPAPDTYFPYVSLLLSSTSLGNANNNLFVDSSGAFNPINRNGNTTQGSFTPYATNWSNYFDGSGDYLSLPSNAAFGFGTGDFTVECWVNPAVQGGHGSSNNDCIIDFRPGTGGGAYGTLYIRSSGAGVSWYANTTNAINGAAISNNTWTHLAVSRVSGNTRLFINGVQSGSTYTDSTNYLQGTPWIGQFNDGVGSGWFQGYISNMRVLKGTGLYSGTFTPPTTALTAISGTSLLTCQSNRFIDNSSNAFTITVNGNTSVQDFNPFSPSYPGISYNQSDITNWSGYLNGSSYWTVPTSTALDVWDNGSGSFTVEAWIFATASIPNNTSIIAKATNDGNPSWTNGWAFQVFNGYLNVNTPGDSRLFNSNTTSVPLNQWVHCALVKSGSTVSIYQNGTRVGTTTNSTAYSNTTDAVAIGVDRNLSGGGKLTGYVSNARMVKGTAVYDPSQSTITVPTSPLTAVSGTSLLTMQSAAFSDNSGNNYLVNSSGTPTVTGNAPFNTTGYWSNYFDGSGDNLSGASWSSAGNFGTSDFTVEGWFYATNAPQSNNVIWSCNVYPNTTGLILRYVGGGSTDLDVRYGTSAIVTASAGWSFNQWHHVAVVRSSGTLTLYIDGVSRGSASFTNNCTDGLQYIGRPSDTSNYAYQGYISNFRIVKGTAVYTGAFTVPTAPLTAISGTSLLTCQNGRFVDNSTNAYAITVNGDTSIQSFDPFYTSTIASNGGSMYFDGSGDYLNGINGAPFALGSGDFTVEMWAYFLDTSGTNKPMFDTGVTTNTGRLLIRQGDNGSSANVVNAYLSGTTAGSPTFNFNAWTHVAVVRSSGTLKVYINGVGGTGVSATANLIENAGIIGKFYDTASYFYGYMSNVRVTKGTAVYTANFTPPTAPLTPSGSTTLLLNGMNAGIYDGTTINDMETVGNAQVTTAVSKFGGSSVYFDGTGDYLNSPNTLAAIQGSTAYTLEAWIYPTSVSGRDFCIYETRGGSGWVWFINSTGYLQVYDSSAGLQTASTTQLSANQWYHVALVRQSGSSTNTYYVNGTAAGTFTRSSFASATQVRIGARNDAAEAFVGYIDELRTTLGVARYTSNFTPPTQAFPTY